MRLNNMQAELDQANTVGTHSNLFLLESIKLRFDNSIDLSVNLFGQRTAVKNSSRGKNTGKSIGSSKHDWTLYGTATSLQFFLKILFVVPKVSNS